MDKENKNTIKNNENVINNESSNSIDDNNDEISTNNQEDNKNNTKMDNDNDIDIDENKNNNDNDYKKINNDENSDNNSKNIDNKNVEDDDTFAENKKNNDNDEKLEENVINNSEKTEVNNNVDEEDLNKNIKENEESENIVKDEISNENNLQKNNVFNETSLDKEQSEDKWNSSDNEIKDKDNNSDNEEYNNDTLRIKKIEKLREKKQARQQQYNLKKRKKIRNKTIIFSCLGVICLYFIGVLVFSFITFPKTLVADVDVSFKTTDGLKNILNQNKDEYYLKIDGLDFSYTIYGKDIKYNFDVDTVIKRIEELKNPYMWPIEFFNTHDFMNNSLVSYDENAVLQIMTPIIEQHNNSAVIPVNAGFNCDVTSKTVSPREEIIGNKINFDAAILSIKSYIGSARKNLTLTEKDQLLPDFYVNDPKYKGALDQANNMVKSVLNLQLGGQIITSLDVNLIGKWLTIHEGYVADLDNQMLHQWASEIGSQYDTIGKSRTYTTPYGKTVTVSGGYAGWEIDEASLIELVSEQVKLGKEQNLDIPCVSDLGVYGKPGSRDWGKRYVDVDLSEQHARFYNESGALIWETDIVSGKPDGKHNTPTGVFKVLFKQSPSTLVGNINPSTGQPEYRTKVQYWMPITNSGVGFHDATWQPGFGGNRYLTIGSHGCLNISLSAAGALYGLISSGDVVVCHN